MSSQIEIKILTFIKKNNARIWRELCMLNKVNQLLDFVKAVKRWIEFGEGQTRAAKYLLRWTVTQVRETIDETGKEIVSSQR